MHAQLGFCITRYGASSMYHARYTTYIKRTSAQLHGAGWSPHQFAVPPISVLLQAGHCGLPAENLHAQLGFSFAIEYGATSRPYARYTIHINTTSEPSSMELGGAHIIFDAMFFLDFWNQKRSCHSILELSELHATHEITVLLYIEIFMLYDLVRKVRGCA
jgi:hypothetical protein